MCKKRKNSSMPHLHLHIALPRPMAGKVLQPTHMQDIMLVLHAELAGLALLPTDIHAHVLWRTVWHASNGDTRERRRDMVSTVDADVQAVVLVGELSGTRVSACAARLIVAALWVLKEGSEGLTCTIFVAS